MGYTKAKESLDRAARLLEEFFETNLVSVWAYGPVVRNNYSNKKERIFLSVVLSDNSPEKLRGFKKLLGKLKGTRLSIPYVFTEEYVKNSLDVFPLEFFYMKSGYDMVKGRDLLSEIEIDKEDMRLACERELRGKALHIRSEFAEAEGSARKMRELLNGIVSVFSMVFSGLLHLKEIKIPATKEELFKKTEIEYLEEKGAVSDMIDACEEDSGDPEKLVENFCLRIDELIYKVDSLYFKEKTKGAEQ
ncbi:MAG: hypothetical protein ACLFQK_10085 [Fibrobacterota bacterium]